MLENILAGIPMDQIFASGPVEALRSHAPEVAVAAALGWASGLRLYLVLFLVGIASRFWGFELPEHLQMLASPLVLTATGFMSFVEFFADKIPLVDSLWDSVHTFIRIPGGAALAAAMLGDTSQSATLAAAILGGTLAASGHLTKAGSRAIINTSPEPVSNIGASLTEDAMVAGGLLTAFHFPWVFLVLLALFLVFALWFARRMYVAVRALVRRARGSAATG